MRYRKKNPTPEMSAWKAIRQSNSPHKVYNHTYTVGKAKIRAVVGFYPGPGGRGGGYVSRIDVRQGRDMTEYLVERDGGLRPILNLPVGTPRAPVPEFSSPEAAIAATAVATQLVEASLLKRNPMSAAERKQYEREVAAYQARKELERGQWWKQQREADQERRGRRLNPPPTFDTCPADMDYNWWVQHYAPQHVRDAARAQQLAEAARLYPVPEQTAAERKRERQDEARYGRAMRRERNPALGSIALAVLPHIMKALGDKVSAFNALPVSERKNRLRTFLQSKRRWGMGVAGGLAAPQIAKSDMALSAIVHAVERYGSEAITEGSAAAARHLEKKNPRKRRRNAGAYGGC